MGVIHFAPVGVRPGAVTSALAYIKNNPDKFPELVGKKEGKTFDERIESIVVFVSPDVRAGNDGDKECTNNDYGSSRGDPWKNLSLVDYIKKFIKQRLIDILPDKSFLYLCTVAPNDYNDCFRKIAAALLKFTEGEKQGKLVWCNITGGTNIMNTAIMQVALLSGRVGLIYYTFLSDTSRYGKYLSPPCLDKTIFDFREIPFTKVNFDETYYHILRIYCDLDNEKGIRPDDIINILKGDGSELNSNTFKINYLLPMVTRRELERIGEANRITEKGRDILWQIEQPLFKALVLPRERTPENIDCVIKENLANDVWEEIRIK